MSDSSTKGSESSPLHSPEQSSSGTNSSQSFPDILDLDAPNSEAPLLEDVPLPSSSARHDVTAIRGTLIVVSIGVLVFLQGTMVFHTCDKLATRKCESMSSGFCLSAIVFCFTIILEIPFKN